jgi:beta-lactamase class A
MIYPAKLAALAEERGAEVVAVAVYDEATQAGFSVRGDRWFHAASTIKIAILAAVYAAVDAGRFRASDPLHVRNRFFSRADGSVFSVAAKRDGNSAVYKALGETMEVGDLAKHMIVTSSNLATNLLLGLVGVDAANDSLRQIGAADGIELVRGVEDERAYERGMSSRVTASGLVALLRAMRESTAFSEASRSAMTEILLGQQFKSGIPAGLPEDVREEAAIAHKTGEISTVQHDAGTVTLPGREPYTLAILTEWSRDQREGRRETVASVSRLVYDALTSERA